MGFRGYTYEVYKELVKFVILGLLLARPLSLYDIRKQFQAGISLFYSASFGSLQRSLALLVADGWITARDDPDSARGRKLYTVTDEGRARWKAWMLQPGSTGTEAEKVALAKVYLLGYLDDPVDRASVLESIHEHLTVALSELTDLEAQVEAAAVAVTAANALPFAYRRATLTYGLRSTRLAREWIDELRENGA